MSEAEQMSRKELLQQNRFEKTICICGSCISKQTQLYWCDSLIGCYYTGNLGCLEICSKRACQSGKSFSHCRSKSVTPALSKEERINQGNCSLTRICQIRFNSTLGVIALMESGEALARQSQIDQSISVFKDVINHPEATVFLRNSARLSLAALFEQQKQWDEAEMMLGIN